MLDWRLGLALGALQLCRNADAAVALHLNPGILLAALKSRTAGR
jgi:hypothetical protein